MNTTKILVEAYGNDQALFLAQPLLRRKESYTAAAGFC
jgi:hypothetical protein